MVVGMEDLMDIDALDLDLIDIMADGDVPIEKLARDLEVDIPTARRLVAAAALPRARSARTDCLGCRGTIRTEGRRRTCSTQCLERHIAERWAG